MIFAKPDLRLLIITVLALMSGGASLSNAEPEITVLGEFDLRPGNPAVSPVDGTIYFSNHPFDNPEYKVMRLREDGTADPYPTPEISRSFKAVIGIVCDKSHILWVLDMGDAEHSPKLWGWNVEENRLHAVHYIPREACAPNSFHQDLVIDNVRSRAYIADMGQAGIKTGPNPALVVVDLNTGEMRRVLDGHETFMPEKSLVMKAEGEPLTFTGEDGKTEPVHLALNPIALDEEGGWVYYSTMSPGALHRMKAEALADFSRTDKEIADTIEVFSDKPSSDGIAFHAGKVYITNVDKGAITIAAEGGELSAWYQDEQEMIWPDALAIAPDGSAVVVVNQLNRAAPFNKGKDGAEPPFTIVRLSEK